MPIGVPLIICGSIALVGSGYAFKKVSSCFLDGPADRQLVYDQHLAHYIEAFIANHLPTSDTRLAAPVPSRSDHQERSTGSTSAWSKGVNRLRRRKASQEDEEPLISLEERPSSTNIHESPQPPRVPSPTNRPTLTPYDREEQEKSDTEPLAKLYDHDHTAPNSHDDEIKSSIFNIPTSSNQSDNVFGDSQLQPPTQDAGPSGTFSFLSLSQVSSPEAPAAMLDSMTFSHLGSGVGSSNVGTSEDGIEIVERDRRDEVMSMPDTGYSTEAFSNLSSPRSGYRSPLSENSGQTGSRSGIGGGGGGLGLAVEDLGMSFVPLRRQASVVSMSESEEGSDWERISVARST
jgi:hypothetical protein